MKPSTAKPSALVVATCAALVLTCPAAAQPPSFGPASPFYAESTLPFRAPPFNLIKDADYQSAIEAGIAAQLNEIAAIANNPAPPDFANTFVALEKSGQLLRRVQLVFQALSGADTNPVLQKVEQTETPRLSALEDEKTLNPKLFSRVKAIYEKRNTLALDPESLRLVGETYHRFTHAGANLSAADATRLRQINEQLSILADAFNRKVLAGTRAAAFTADDKSALAGLSEAQIAAAGLAAKARNQPGYLLPLQNTTDQPALQSLSARATRQALLDKSWNRNEHGDDNDTRDTIAELAKLRAAKAKLLGFPTFAAWKLENQMAKTPEAALRFMDAVVPAATANANSEAKEIQAVINAQNGGFAVAAFDWQYYAEQVRKAKYDIDESEVRPYLELNRVLQDGVFYAATRLYGITFKERKDIPVYHPDVRVFEVTDTDGKPLALFYCDYFKRDNKRGGAWTSSLVASSRLLGALPVVYNVANFSKPAPGEPALISFDDAQTMFHEFGHALHSMFSSVEYPSLARTPADFAEFPSQFNEHWRDDPAVFSHFARHYKTGAPMPAELVARLRRAATFNQSYELTSYLAAAETDMQWHLLPADAPLQAPDTFEQAALERTKLALALVPPRYRSTYFGHIWYNSAYSAEYYAYLWSEMLDDDAYDWFSGHGGLTRANGDRFRKMILSRGNTQDLETLYETWRGGPPAIDGLLRQRGLAPK